jgi:hypothetical protein
VAWHFGLDGAGRCLCCAGGHAPGGVKHVVRRSRCDASDFGSDLEGSRERSHNALSQDHAELRGLLTRDLCLL